jgi:hypothetical protein
MQLKVLLIGITIFIREHYDTKVHAPFGRTPAVFSQFELIVVFKV